MILKSLKLSNIRSYTDTTIEFPSGSTLLSGDIGSGKSTVLMAIDFGLFGVRRGEISGSDLLRHGKKSGYVRLEFDIDGRRFTIQRNLERKRNINQTAGFLVVDGIEFEYMPTELTAKILEVLGYPAEIRKGSSVFRYTVYTPQEEMKHILLYEADRLSTLRRIFDIDKYGRVRNNTERFLSELRSVKRELENYARDIDKKIKEKKEKEQDVSKIFFEIKQRGTELEDLEQKIVAGKAEIDKGKKEIGILTRRKSELSVKDSELRLKKSRLSTIDNDLVEFTSQIADVEKSLAEDVKRPPIDEQLLTSDLHALEVDRDSFIKQKVLLSDEAQRLQDILNKKVCSFCGQDVHDTQRFFANIENKLKQANNIEKHIAKAEKKMSDYRKYQDQWKDYKNKLRTQKTFEKHKSDLVARRKRAEDEREILAADVKKLASDVEKLRPVVERFDDVHNLFEAAESRYNESMREKLDVSKAKSRLEQQREDIMDYINHLANEIEKRQIERKRVEKLNRVMDWLDKGFMNVMETMEQHVMLALQYEFNSFFQAWFDVIMQSGISVRIDESFSPIIFQNGFETDYQNLSGGEKTSVALAYRLALNKVINSISENIKTKDLIILDEPTDGFSNEQLDKLRDIIDQLNLEQVIIVSHEPKIDTFVDNVIKLYKENHVSNIVN